MFELLLSCFRVSLRGMCGSVFWLSGATCVLLCVAVQVTQFSVLHVCPSALCNTRNIRLAMRT